MGLNQVLGKIKLIFKINQDFKILKYFVFKNLMFFESPLRSGFVNVWDRTVF